MLKKHGIFLDLSQTMKETSEHQHHLSSTLVFAAGFCLLPVQADPDLDQTAHIDRLSWIKYV